VKILSFLLAVIADAIACPSAFCLAADNPPAPAPNQAELLRKIPPALLRYYGAVPDSNGMIGYNRDGFKAAAFQRGGTVRLAIAAASGDEKLADACWKAIDVAFEHQTAEGNFGDPATSVAFWLCELCRTLLVVRDSPVAGHFAERIAGLAPKIALAAKWLEQQKSVLQREDGKTPNRLFFDAEAFGFAGLLLNDTALQTLSREFLNQGMKLYRAEDGVFLEHGGGDSSYQAVCLLRLQEIVLRFPDAAVEEAIRKGAQWEIGRIGPDGAVRTEGNTRVKAGGEKFMGHEKQPNIGEISAALLYYQGRTGDKEALAAVERLNQFAAQRR
jgi:hypothetical protein